MYDNERLMRIFRNLMALVKVRAWGNEAIEPLRTRRTQRQMVKFITIYYYWIIIF